MRVPWTIMVAGQVSSLGWSHLPLVQSLHVFLVSLEPLYMLSKIFTITPCMMSHIRRIHTKENRKNYATLCLVAVNDMDKFVQTKWRRAIVDRKHWNKNSRFFNGLDEWRCDFFSSLKITIINECEDSLVIKGLVEMASETVPSVTAPEAEEHFVCESIGNWRGRGIWLHSHENWDKLDEKRVWECRVWMNKLLW